MDADIGARGDFGLSSNFVFFYNLEDAVLLNLLARLVQYRIFLPA